MHNAEQRSSKTAERGLLPQLAQTGRLIVVLVQHLCGGQVKVLLRYVHSPLPQCVHASLGAHTLQLGS